ncbi:MAG: tetratricopeptide repeat protein [Crocinitomicaceae bacterium]|nr:tetratricopeptide repeat protein [Crocinitomicaceae bacterium]
MKEGDDLKNIKDYTAAIDRYTKALALKPGDSAATQKINDIKKIQEEEQKQAQLEQQYKDYMAKADQYFNAKDYTNAKMYYQKAYELKQDPAIQTKIKEIDDLISKTQNEQQLQAKYDAAIKEADALYKAGNLEAALAKYEEASAIKSSETYPQQKISEIKQKIGQLNTLISQQSEQEQQEQRYKSKIGEADAAFTAKSWESARELYREALMIKPNDTYATNQITEIEKQMKLETDAEVEANYQKIVQKADNLKKEDRLDEALVYYNNALNLKAYDPYPKQMIDEINRIKTERQNSQQEQQKLENEYNALIKEADIAFNSQNWTVALAKYKEALLKKPGEPYPQGRISEINTKMNEQNQVQQQDTEYNNYISQADALFNQGKYLESIPVYQQALGVKPNDAYATNQIQEAERREKEKSVDEAEQEYQKILTAAQKKFDEGDYLKALDYYKRALTMKPGDTYVQKRIAEINQLLDNQKSQSEFDKYVLQANTYFEKSQWKEAKEYYLKALDIKDDKYCRDQIAIIDKNQQQQSTTEIEAEYQKIIKKADEYFAAKNYTKAKSLYERALSLKPSDPYPKVKLDELVCLIDPKRCVQDSNPLPDYGDPVNTTEVDIEAQLLEAEDQRQFMVNQKVEQQRVSAEDENTANSDIQTNESFETTNEANKINQDLEEKEWSAEVHRTEANLEVIDMQITLEEEEYDRGTTNENDMHLTNQGVTNMNIEIEERNDEDDHPREEYLADVERIKVENEYEERSNTNDQTNEVHEGTDYVEVMQIENITNDPNNDVERKNTEVYVEDLNVVLINENNQNSWSQEDEVMDVKENTEVLIDERIAENVNNDIPREESAEELSDYTVDKENSDRNIANDQYDETFESKTYEEKMSIDIEQNNMDNDIPRQETEEKVEDTELLIEENTSDNSNDQNNVVNTSDDKLDDLEIVIEEQNAGNDQPRQDYEENVVEIDLELQDYKDNLSELNEDNSHITKDNTETLTDQKTNFDTQADNKATMNSDETNDAVEDIVEENKTISDGNNEEVAVTEDYIEEVKHEETVKDNPPMKNELGEKYPEGVTEEVFAINDENGLLSKYIVRRIVVINGTGYNYEKVQTRYGTITYSRDGQPISEYQWQDETEAATLNRN